MIRAATILALALSGPALAQTDWVDDVEAVVKPNPTYPPLAAFLGMNALCRAAYNVSDDGRAVDICVRCETVVRGTPPPRAVELAARQFVQTVEVALGEWRYAQPYWGYQGTRTQFEFFMEGETSADLPAPPAMGECLGPQIS